MTLQRELYPALSPADMTDADRAFRHAERRVELHGQPSPGKRALVRVKCNQLAPDNASACDWQTTVESTVVNAERAGRVRLAQHLAQAHPYLTRRMLVSIVGNAWVNLRDVTGGR